MALYPLHYNFPSRWQDYFGARYYFDDITSTQSYLRAHCRCRQPIFVTAQRQSNGEGQRRKKWQTPIGQLAFSICQTVAGGAHLHQGLTQAIALTLAETLDASATQLRLKWPNDLYLDGKKFAGLLVDSQTSGNDSLIVLGVGINIAPLSPYSHLQLLDPQANVQNTLQKIMPAIINALLHWQQSPYLPLQNRWNEYDIFYQKSVALSTHPRAVTLCGIDQKGRLIAKDDSGIHVFTHTRILH